MEKTKLDKIKYYAHEQRVRELTEEEKAEQHALRMEYVAEIRASFGAQLESTVDQMIHAKRISSVATYSMAYEWFHETNFHLNTAGAELRTRLLMDDLLKYFKTAG